MTAAPKSAAPRDLVPIRRALISVSDKSGLVPFARRLSKLGVELISTGGSARALREAGLDARDVSDVTAFPEMLDGRVKTLHPMIHGGLLARRGDPAHMAALDQHGIAPIDLLVVNLYPFEATVASGAPYAECVENIDIGGPAMIRAAAKNHDDVAVLVEPRDGDELLQAIEAEGGTRLELRRRLAARAYALTAAYDAAIAGWMARETGDEIPYRRAFAGRLAQPLRYGENPHQRAAFYLDGSARPGRGHRPPAAGQGAELQQHQRHGRRLRAGGRSRPRRLRGAGRRHRQARQSLRRRDRTDAGRGLRAGPMTATGSRPSAASSR